MLLDATGTDVLADVLDSLKLRGRIFCRCELSAPWALGFAAGDFLHFHLIGRGNCWLRPHGKADAIALKEGDLLVVTRGQLSDEPKTPPIPISDLVRDSLSGLRAVLRHGGGGRATELICGAFEFEGPDTKSFLAVLPEWIRVQKDEPRGNEWLAATYTISDTRDLQTRVGRHHDHHPSDRRALR